MLCSEAQHSVFLDIINNQILVLQLLSVKFEDMTLNGIIMISFYQKLLLKSFHFGKKIEKLFKQNEIKLERWIK